MDGRNSWFPERAIAEKTHLYLYHFAGVGQRSRSSRAKQRAHGRLRMSSRGIAIIQRTI